MRSRGKIRSSSRGRRRGKRSVKLVKEGEEDRISELSDDLITHILSYVVSRVAVKTMVLSKQWVNLWFTLSCVNFKLPLSILFGHFENYVQNYFEKRDDQEYVDAVETMVLPRPLENIRNCLLRLNLKLGSCNYENFVRNFLKNRDQQYVLSKLTIDCYYGGGEVLTICLDYAICHDMEHLSICNGDLADYPCKINFGCLKTLHLIRCKNLTMMDYWTLPSLTSLYLEAGSIGNQILRFENLKELILVEKITGKFNEATITINCPKLQSLTLYPVFRHTFIVSAPSLYYLRYCSRHVSAFSARDGFPCIKQVYIDIRKKGDFFNYSDWTVRKLAMQNFISMLKAVSETPFLELSSETIEGLRMIRLDLWEYEHSSLGNLKFISLRGPGLFDMRPPKTTDYVINYLLTNSPCAKIIRKL